jgi:cell division septum initiation protein DivIVA
MTNTVVERVLGDLYDIIQNSKNVPLSSNKSIIDREAVLDLLDEAIENLPSDIKKAKEIVDACNALTERSRKDAQDTVSAAKSEAELIVSNARSTANSMTSTARSEADSTVKRANNEASAIISNAKTRAQEMVTREAVYQETQRQCKEMTDKANAQIAELKRVSNKYMDDSLAETEAVIAQSLQDVKATRAKFQALTNQQALSASSTASKSTSFFDDEEED